LLAASGCASSPPEEANDTAEGATSDARVLAPLEPGIYDEPEGGQTLVVWGSSTRRRANLLPYVEGQCYGDIVDGVLTMPGKKRDPEDEEDYPRAPCSVELTQAGPTVRAEGYVTSSGRRLELRRAAFLRRPDRALVGSYRPFANKKGAPPVVRALEVLSSTEERLELKITTGAGALRADANAVAAPRSTPAEDGAILYGDYVASLAGECRLRLTVRPIGKRRYEIRTSTSEACPELGRDTLQGS